MYPAPFDYHRAESVADAIRVLSEIGDGARVLAGGQSLLPLLKLRFDEPTALVDIGRIPNMDLIDATGGEVRIGALATHRRIGASDLASEVPIIADCARGIADNQVRSRGTIGGSVSCGDPNCDWPALLHTLDATIETRGPDGERSLDVNGFVEDFFQTCLQPGEIVTGIRFAKPGPGSGGAYCGFKRAAPAYPTVSIGVHFNLADGHVQGARLAVGSVGFIAMRLKEAESELEGKELSDDVVEKVAEAAAAAVDPVEDQRGSVDFKRRITAKLTHRAIGIAKRRAEGETVKNSHEYY